MGSGKVRVRLANPPGSHEEGGPVSVPRLVPSTARLNTTSDIDVRMEEALQTEARIWNVTFLAGVLVLVVQYRLAYEILVDRLWTE